MRRRRVLTVLASGLGVLGGCSGTGPFAGESRDDDGLGSLTPAPVPDRRRTVRDARARGPIRDDSGRSYAADFRAGRRRVGLPWRRYDFAEAERIDFDGGLEANDGSDDERTEVARGAGEILLRNVHLEWWFAGRHSTGVPLLRGRLVNAQARELEVPLAWTPPFAGTSAARHAGGSSARFLFAPTANDDLAEATPGVRRGEDGNWNFGDDDAASWYPDLVEMRPYGEVPFEALAIPLVDGDRVPVGRYGFGDGASEPFLRVWDPRSPGPTTESAFAGAAPPALPDREVRWFHDADASTAVWLGPERERLELPGRLGWRLVNRSIDVLRIGDPDLRLYKLADGRWHAIDDVERVVSASGIEEIVLTPGRVTPAGVFPGEQVEATRCLSRGPPGECRGDGASTGHLGGGRYAVAVDAPEGRTTYAALLDVAAPAVTVEPTGTVTVADREAGRILVAEEYEHGESARERGGTRFVVERADGADRRFLPEQVMQPYFEPLRNALPFFEPGVDRIELLDGRRPSGFPAAEPKWVRFRFDGEDYRAVYREVDEPDGAAPVSAT